jgi:hypothetical protein
MENCAEILRNIGILACTHQITGGHEDAHIIGISKEQRKHDL